MAVTFENHMKTRLRAQLSDAIGDAKYNAFDLTRTRLNQDVFGEIKGADRNLSDHGERHINNVLHNALKLISPNHKIHRLSGIDLYCLGMFILFHDVGNLFGRESHHQKVSQVYDWARGTDASFQHEKTLVLAAAAAHTGLAPDQTADTLRGLTITEHLDNHPVRLQELAAILRFADELAEGPQRTSEFMRRQNQYPEDNRIFHDYASVTNVFIDRGNSRVCLSYELDIGCQTDEREEHRDARITELLNFIYRRVVKLDQERRYNRYYSEILTAFKSTEMSLNFRCNGVQLPINLPPMQLDDKVIPGDPCRSLVEIDDAYDIPALLTALKNQAARGTTQ